MEIDLLNLVDQGGCSAKLSASELKKALADLPKITHENLLVDIDTHDDAGVYKIRDDYALVQTTDFFPPVCSGAYDYGQIAAANALSDVYAMGGQVLTALNILMFPPDLPMSILKDIIKGGQEKVVEAGGLIVGGHTITNEIPVYGLAVTGWVHPEQIITNDQAQAGDMLILTKPLGSGVIISAKKNNSVDEDTYRAAIDTMKQLNKKAAVIMTKYGVKCATDITGFGLLGHGLKMALGSKVSIRLNALEVPAIQNVMELIETGFIPGAGFRNLEFVEDQCDFSDQVPYNTKMLFADAQTSGGILMAIHAEMAASILDELKAAGYASSVMIGEVIQKEEKSVIIV
ncbi:MAG: selenide, water dikinase SelD [Marinilabiliales bacterium]|nr:MAG: selenide, water dikinase SelD [Marinilabiliales bacterium]